MTFNYLYWYYKPDFNVIPNYVVIDTLVMLWNMLLLHKAPAAVDKKWLLCSGWISDSLDIWEQESTYLFRLVFLYTRENEVLYELVSHFNR